MKDNHTPKDVLPCLIEIRSQVIRYYKPQNKYPEWMTIFSEEAYFSDENTHLTFKDISKITGLSTAKLGKQLLAMYEELFNAVEDQNAFIFRFDQPEIIVHASYLKKNVTFRMDGLAKIPRRGEQLHLFFLKAQFGINVFYVEDVQHEFFDDKHLITVVICGGFYNAYWEYEKAKAMEEGRVDFWDLHTKHEFELKERVYNY